MLVSRIFHSCVMCTWDKNLFKFFFFFSFILTEIVIGTRVHQDIFCLVFTVHAVIICATLNMRGAVNLLVLLIPTSRATMRTFGRDLTGIDKEWCHAPDLVIISLAFIDPLATICIVSKNSNAANCRLQKVRQIHDNTERIFPLHGDHPW